MAHQTGGNRSARGFTLIELLIVVAIIGLLASIAIPVYGRTVERARRNAFVTEANQIYNAFRQYYIDNGKFPADGGPNPLSLSTLAPLTSDGHLSAHAAASFLRKQVDNSVFIYIAPDIAGADSDILLALHPKYDPDEWIYIFHTGLLVDTYGALDGVYFYRDGSLIRVDQVVDS